MSTMAKSCSSNEKQQIVLDGSHQINFAFGGSDINNVDAAVTVAHWEFVNKRYIGGEIFR